MVRGSVVNRKTLTGLVGSTGKSSLTKTTNQSACRQPGGSFRPDTDSIPNTTTVTKAACQDISQTRPAIPTMLPRSFITTSFPTDASDCFGQWRYLIPARWSRGRRASTL
jgi:hypothetical protein